MRTRFPSTSRRRSIPRQIDEGAGTRQTPPLGLFADQATPRLYDAVVEAVRVRHYSRRTEEAYTSWIKQFILFHNKKHPVEMGTDQVSSFLTYLAERA